jgi:hypothetical protein
MPAKGTETDQHGEGDAEGGKRSPLADIHRSSKKEEQRYDQEGMCAAEECVVWNARRDSESVWACGGMEGRKYHTTALRMGRGS